jgi:Pyridoxamine 5'-phosphate oxidase
MGKVYAELDERLTKFISRQPVFFVATAPCLTSDGEGGHVNVSPKGYRDTFAVLDPTTVAYVDLTGSGAETIAHLRQNGRITIMFCSFTKQAKILRIYGRGHVVLPDRRAIIVVEADRIADSCGYAVPQMELTEERDLLAQMAEQKSLDELAEYREEKNAVSIDGLPALGR